MLDEPANEPIGAEEPECPVPTPPARGPEGWVALEGRERAGPKWKHIRACWRAFSQGAGWASAAQECKVLARTLRAWYERGADETAPVEYRTFRALVEHARELHLEAVVERAMTGEDNRFLTRYLEANSKAFRLGKITQKKLEAPDAPDPLAAADGLPQPVDGEEAFARAVAEHTRGRPH